MKVKSIFRMQTILMALGAALLLATAAHAQQDMDPTNFPDGANVEPFRQPVAANLNNTVTYALNPANALSAQQAIATELTTDQQATEAAAAEWTTMDRAVVSFLMISVTLISLYGLARAKTGTERRSEIGAFTPRSATAQ